MGLCHWGPSVAQAASGGWVELGSRILAGECIVDQSGSPAPAQASCSCAPSVGFPLISSESVLCTVLL